MELTIIHGQMHKGSTWHVTDSIRRKLADEHTVVHEFYMPKDTPDYCVGCFRCIQKGEQACPHADQVQNISAAMRRSDVVIIDSPTYCFEMTGQLKTLFDHFAYQWLSHRPRREMFAKVGIVVSTAAGAGAARVTKSMARQLSWWGMARVYRLPVSVSAASWAEVSPKILQKIERQTGSVADRARRAVGHVLPPVKTRLLFGIMRKMQAGNTWNGTDQGYWQDNGWLATARPWG